MANHTKEAEKLINFLRQTKEEKKSSSFALTHEELTPHVNPGDDGNYDPKRIAGILRADMRKAGISFTQTTEGYRFNIKSDRKPSAPTAPTTPALEIKDNAENTLSTMTDFGSKYIAPKIFDDVRVLVAHGLQVLLVGPPGCGKSRLLEQLAIAFACHPMRRQMSQIFDPEQLVGGLQVVKDEEADINITKFVPGSLTQAVQNGWFFIGDEYDNATPECNESLKMITEKGGKMVVETEHGVEVIPKHEKFRMAFTANTWGRGDSTGDFPNAYKQNSAALDRIDAFIEMGYDVDVERAIMADHGMENHLIEMFYGKPGSTDPGHAGLIPQLRTVVDQQEIDGEIGMRKIIAFCKMYPLLGWHKAFLYSIMNKFEKDAHHFIGQTISSKFTARMVPTADTNLIKAAESDLKRYKLKGL